jgi:two-component system, OmpR family, phosphate regulon response regulator PhoB
LRKALNEPGERDPIRTIRSAGYSFDETFASKPHEEQSAATPV